MCSHNSASYHMSKSSCKHIRAPMNCQQNGNLSQVQRLVEEIEDDCSSANLINGMMEET